MDKLLFQMLALDSMMTREIFFERNLTSYHVTIQDIFTNLEELVQSREGNEMKLIKFHLFSHLIDDIRRYGSCRNWSGGPRESNFKSYKSLKKLTQQRTGFSFCYQLGNRIMESESVRRTLKYVQGKYDLEIF